MRFERASWNCSLVTLVGTDLDTHQYEDCEVTVTVERKRQSRSKDQLAYYWGVVLPEIAHYTGHSVEELHYIFKSRHLRKKLFWRGRDVTTIGTTTALTLAEMSAFISSVILEASEMGIAIPEAVINNLSLPD